MTPTGVVQQEHIIRLIETRTGLSAHRHHRDDMLNEIERLSGGDYGALLTHLQQAPESDGLWQVLIRALTVGETYFLRDNNHFRLLREQILPGIVRDRANQPRPKIRVWSVGCSSGEEAYSIAITLRERLPDFSAWDIDITATDINQHAIQQAREGIYRRWSFRRNDLDFEARYFTPVTGGLQINPQIKDMVSFRQANIIEASQHHYFDVVFCRNVMLYFGEDGIRRTEKALFDALVPGGWLMLGQSEAIRFERERWLLHLFPGSPVYQKPVVSRPSTLPEEPVRYEPPTSITGNIDLSLLDEVVRDAAYADAVDAIHRDDHDAAEKYLVDVLTKEPRHARAHALMAYILANRSAIPEARIQLDTALRLDPLLPDAHYIKAMIHIEHNDREAGFRALQAALYCDGSYALASFMLGNLHAMRGELSRAHRLWRTSLGALSRYDDEDYVADVSDVNAGMLRLLLDNHLQESIPAEDDEAID